MGWSTVSSFPKFAVRFWIASQELAMTDFEGYVPQNVLRMRSFGCGGVV